MAIIHVTTSDAWEGIQEEGAISPGMSRGTTGPDRTKVSAFRVGEDLLTDQDFLGELKRFWVGVKNTRRAQLNEVPLSERDIVILVIDNDVEVGWKESKTEVLLNETIPGISAFRKTDSYLKTERNVPASAVTFLA